MYNKQLLQGIFLQVTKQTLADLSDGYNSNSTLQLNFKRQLVINC